MRSLICASLLIGSACISPSSASRATAPSASPSWTLDPAHLFRAGSGITSGTEACVDESAVASVLDDFASAFNSGDANAIRGALSQTFWGVFINAGGLTQAAYSRDDAVALLLHRKRSGEQLGFGRPAVTGLLAWDGAAHFSLVPVALRRSDAAVDMNGRGALYCGGATRGIKILSIWK